RPDFPFAAADEVVWRAGKQRHQGFPAIETAYPSLREFFQKLGVAERATPRLALETLGQVADAFDRGKGQVLDDLDRLRLREAYETLAEADFAKEGGSEGLQGFLEDGKLLGNDGVFHRCKELIAPDDATLAELFRKHGVGPFLWVPGA